MSTGVHGNDPVIKVRGLTKRFGDVAAVAGVNLSVREGEIFGLIGPDAAGKTTIMRMLCGIVPADEGSIHVAGQDVVRDPEAVKRRIGYLSQVFSLYGDLTVEENLDFCADLYLSPRSEVARYGRPAGRPYKAEMLRLGGLAPFKTRQAGHLSGGMQQKLALMCALIHRPQVLILDEPTTGVDPVSRREFWRILANLPAQGVTVLLSSPYMEEAARCHRLALIDRGHILATGTAAELQAAVRGSVVEVVTPEVRRASRALSAVPGVLNVTAFGDALHVQIEAARRGPPVEHEVERPPEVGERIASVLRESSVEFSAITVIEPSLEDAFLDLVGSGEAARD